MTADVVYRFRLYISGEAVNSTQALANLQALCREQLAGRCNIDIVDVISEPERALEDGILMTPTLLRLAPTPLREIIGTLSDSETVMQALDLPEPTKALDLPTIERFPADDT